MKYTFALLLMLPITLTLTATTTLTLTATVSHAQSNNNTQRCTGDCVIDPRADEKRAMWEAMGYTFNNTKIMGSDDRKKVTSADLFNSIPRIICNVEGTNTSDHGTGIVVSRSKGVLITAAHTFVKRNRPLSKSAQLANIKRLCRVELRNALNQYTFQAKIRDFIIGDHFEATNYIDETANDWIVIRLDQAFPANVKSWPIEHDYSGDLNNAPATNISYQLIPAKNGQPVRVELLYGNGKVRLNSGGPSMGHHEKLLLHDVDTSGVASGSGLIVDIKGKKAIVAMHLTSFGTDGLPYHEASQNNIALKIHGPMVDAIKRLSAQP